MIATDRVAAPSVQLPSVPAGCRPTWRVSAALVDPAMRPWMIRALQAEGISAAFHYVPLHSAPYARQSAAIADVDLPVTDRVGASLVRLPVSAAFTEAECDHVLTASTNVFRPLASESARA